MRKKIEHYQGYNEVTQSIINQINIIAFKRYSEGIYGLLHEDYEDFNDLCHSNSLNQEDTYITLGEDWFIIYTQNKSYVELIEWVSLDCVDNKFMQTIEMFNELKNILLSNPEATFFSIMKHNTSYKFYSDFITRGFLEEYSSDIITDPNLPTYKEKIIQHITQTYGRIANFLKDENRDKTKEELLEDYIYHEIAFTTTDKFIKKYKK